MIKIFRAAGVVTPSKSPPLYEQLLPLPTPCFKMFLERSLYDPPTTPLQASFTTTPSPSTTSPPKNLIIHLTATLLNNSVELSSNLDKPVP